MYLKELTGRKTNGELVSYNEPGRRKSTDT